MATRLDPTPVLRHSAAHFALVLLLSACGAGGAAVSPTAKDAESAERAPSVEPVLQGPAVIGSAAPAPDWLDEACEPDCAEDPWKGVTRWGEDESAVVAQTARGQLFVAGHRRGVVGPLALPAARFLWLQPASNGRLIGADSKGQLWGAGSASAGTQSDGWTRLARGFRGYVGDVNGTWVAVADRDQVYVGQWQPNGALTLSRSVPRKGLGVARILVRRDGVVVAGLGQGRQRMLTMVRGPAAKRWEVPEFQPVALERLDDHIYATGHDCPVALSVDARRWTTHFTQPQPQAESRLGMMSVQAVPRGREAYGQPAKRQPAAPDPGAAVAVGKTPRCSARAERIANVQPAEHTPESCRGWACLRISSGRPVSASSLAIGFFADGACGPGAQRCGAGDAFVRPPHAALGDLTTGSVAVAALPPGCATPQRLEAAWSLAVLYCKAAGGGSNVYTSRGTAGRWAFEGRLQGLVPQQTTLTAGGDGTLLAAASCPPEGACVAWIRRPLPSGAPAAWRAVTVPGGVTFRAGLGGHALAVTTVPGQTLVEVGLRANRPLKQGAPGFSQVVVNSAGRVILLRGGKLVTLQRDGTLR